jgi:aspartate aminotransferase
MTAANFMLEKMKRVSWIRTMFEEGTQLKKIHGADKVYDFSIGNPNVPPPDEFTEALREAATTCGPTDHCYMPNAGYPDVCSAIADHISREQEVTVPSRNIIMTCGAAAAMNVIFKAILDPGDEVIVLTPRFVDYDSYIDNHGGVMKLVPTRDDFTMDLEAIDAALTTKTKAILINSPNNPTGQIYSGESLAGLGDMLTRRKKQWNRTIYLVNDEPYRKIVFDGNQVPGLFKAYPESLIATSYSKDLSIPGERIGYAAINPAAEYIDQIIAGMIIANRILGFINAPALMQRVVACLQGLSVDAGVYQRKRDLICNGLKEAGYDLVVPPGTFYLFPKTPIADDVAFVRELQKELVLTTPGTGFDCPGFFRIAFCVEDKTITKALPGFRRVMKKYQ